MKNFVTVLTLPSLYTPSRFYFDEGEQMERICPIL